MVDQQILPLIGAVDELQVWDLALTPVQAFALNQARSVAISRQPVVSSACAGGAAEITATLAPGRAATFQWQYETAPNADIWFPLQDGGLGRGGQTPIQVTSPAPGSSTLRLAPVAEIDQARYRCLAALPCGTTVSFPAQLMLTPCCPSDFNGDGLRNPDDLSEFITCFFLDLQFPGFCPPSDFNRDGLLNPDDLSEFITIFFLVPC
jgi:hypothetical protein